MRLVLLAMLFAACSKSEPGAAAVPEPRPSIKDPIGFCARARLAFTTRRKCFPEDSSMKMALDEISDLETKAPAEPVARRAQALKCARMLDGMARAQQPEKCPLDATDDELRELAAFIAPEKK